MVARNHGPVAGHLLPRLVATRPAPFDVARPVRGATRAGSRRFHANSLAMVGLVVFALVAATALLAPFIAPHNPVASDVVTAGVYRKAAWLDDVDPRRAGTWTYPLGTDAIGRDVASRLVYATRASLFVGLATTALVLAVAVPAGLIAGYVGGWGEDLLMRLADLTYAFPALLFFIVAQVSLRETRFGAQWNGLALLTVVLAVVGWPGIARLVRGQTKVLGEQDFVLAARASGASAAWIVRRHVLPNAMGPLAVAAANSVPGLVIAEAVLSYLGVGMRPSVRPDNPFPSSLGQMILDGSMSWQAQPWMLIAPSLVLGGLTLALTLVGDGLRDALDVRATPR